MTAHGFHSSSPSYRSTLHTGRGRYSRAWHRRFGDVLAVRTRAAVSSGQSRRVSKAWHSRTSSTSRAVRRRAASASYRDSNSPEWDAPNTTLADQYRQRSSSTWWQHRSRSLLPLTNFPLTMSDALDILQTQTWTTVLHSLVVRDTARAFSQQNDLAIWINWIFSKITVNIMFYVGNEVIGQAVIPRRIILIFVLY